MPTRERPKVVTIDEGAGPVKVVKDSGGRVITKEQIIKIRDKQQHDLEQVTDLRDKLQAGDAAAVAQVTDQIKDRLAKRLTLVARQQQELLQQRSKLEAGDAQTTDQVVRQMIHCLSRRIERITKARDRSGELLSDLQ